MSYGHHKLDRQRMGDERTPCRELAAAVGAALSIPPGYPGSITHGPVRERLWQALKAWKAAS